MKERQRLQKRKLMGVLRKFQLFGIRLLVNVAVVSVLAMSGLGLYFVADSSVKVEQSSRETKQFIVSARDTVE